jgi:hypothetical protein
LSWIDDVTIANLNPNRSRREQVSNGLRLGIGAGAFLIAMMLLASGLRRVMAAPPNHLADWVAWGEICIALVLLFLTAQVWLLLVAYGAFFGFLYEALVFISGKELSAPYRPIPRLGTLAVAFFALTTFLMLVRFNDHLASILDRVALTFYVLAFVFALSGHSSPSSLLDTRLMAGWMALAIAWCVYRWNTREPQTPEAQFSR